MKLTSLLDRWGPAPYHHAVDIKLVPLELLHHTPTKNVTKSLLMIDFTIFCFLMTE